MKYKGTEFVEGMKVKAKSLAHTKRSMIRSDKGQSVGDTFTIDSIRCYDLKGADFYVRQQIGVGWHPGDLVPVSDHIKVTGEVRPI